MCVCVLELPELLHGLWRPERPERGRCKLCVCVLGNGGGVSCVVCVCVVRAAGTSSRPVETRTTGTGEV